MEGFIQVGLGCDLCIAWWGLTSCTVRKCCNLHHVNACGLSQVFRGETAHSWENITTRSDFVSQGDAGRDFADIMSPLPSILGI